MLNREKTIEALDDLNGFVLARAKMAMPGDAMMKLLYWSNACEDAIAFLREQNPVKPQIGETTEFGGLVSRWYMCGECGQPIDAGDLHCRRCGRTVRWDG